MKQLRHAGALAVVLALGTITGANASGNQPVPIEERARGAARVVVATVAETTARYERNEFGDEIIVTRAALKVEESLKGPAGPMTLVVEGGTVDGITMRVSSLPVVSAGERAVFFVTPGPGGELKPHLRGQGILKLDPADRVPGSSLTLDEIRQMVGRAGR